MEYVSWLAPIAGLTGTAVAQQIYIRHLSKERDDWKAKYEKLRAEEDKRSNIKPASAGREPERRRSVWDPDWLPTLKK